MAYVAVFNVRVDGKQAYKPGEAIPAMPEALARELLALGAIREIAPVAPVAPVETTETTRAARSKS